MDFHGTVSNGFSIVTVRSYDQTRWEFSNGRVHEASMNLNNRLTASGLHGMIGNSSVLIERRVQALEELFFCIG